MLHAAPGTATARVLGFVGASKKQKADLWGRIGYRSYVINKCEPQPCFLALPSTRNFQPL